MQSQHMQYSAADKNYLLQYVVLQKTGCHEEASQPKYHTQREIYTES